MNPKNPLSNASGYPDPTAYYGTQAIIQRETKQQQTISALIHCIKTISGFAGFEIIGRITLRDTATGKIYK